MFSFFFLFIGTLFFIALQIETTLNSNLNVNVVVEIIYIYILKLNSLTNMRSKNEVEIALGALCML